MSFRELFLVALGLSADAFAAAVCLGLSGTKRRFFRALTVGGYFGFFQACMPVIGFLLGQQFHGILSSVDHWVVFGLLSLIGGNMIRESFAQTPSHGGSLSPFHMIPLALATSLDAWAVGMTFACLHVPVRSSACLIGLVTFLLSFLGVLIGHRVGSRCHAVAERIGGGILILIGTKILLSHLGIL